MSDENVPILHLTAYDPKITGGEPEVAEELGDGKGAEPDPRMQTVKPGIETMNLDPKPGEPDPCPEQGFGHDSRQCIACSTRIAWVRERVRKQNPPDDDELPTISRLDRFLAEPDSEVEYRIDGVLPMGGNCLLAAAQKAGKSTMIGNTIRSLSDDDPFLGLFEVQAVKRIVLIDDELDRNMLKRWLRAHKVQHQDRIEVVSLRGQLSTFNILDDETRARWVEHIGPCDVLILDCLRPALDALGLDENHDAGKFLVAWDELKLAVGASESIVVHHMGHQGQRSRGDSRILDWPDAVWNLHRQDIDNPTSPRFFSAYGRDVEVAEGRLTYDAVSRRLTYQEGSRKLARQADAAEEFGPRILAYVEGNPGQSTNQLLGGVGGDRIAARAALEKLFAEGLLRREKRQGRGGGYAYFAEKPNQAEPD